MKRPLSSNSPNPARAMRLAAQRTLLACAWVIIIAAAVTARAEEDGQSAVSLSYPYTMDAMNRIEGHENLAQKVLPSYVTVIIHDTRPSVNSESFDMGVGNVYKTAGGVEAFGEVNRASGIILDRRGHVITAAHIVRRKDFAAEVMTHDGRIVGAKIIDVSPERELALLRITPYSGMRPALSHMAQDVKARQKVINIGADSRKKERRGLVSLGFVVTPDREKRLNYGGTLKGYGFDNAITMALEAVPGHSGGPVFDAEGRLVGMLASFGMYGGKGKAARAAKISWAVPARDIAAYLREVTKGNYGEARTAAP